jgi:Lrp/AsnC family transcriptional regulator for asnA, asnC and gidA
MEKIDVKDKKILYQLDLNSRQSFTKIGKKVGLNQDLIAYRTKRLQEKGIIKYFITYIDEYKLGYTQIRFYITYQNVTPEIKKEIINFFVNYKFIRYVWSTEGEYDLLVIMAVKNMQEFYTVWEKLLTKYRKYFAKHVFSIFFQHRRYRYSFLLDEEANERTDRIKLIMFGNVEKTVIDDLDLSILKIIVNDAKIPTIEIAKKLNSTARTINSRIQKLIKLGIIKCFSVVLDLQKIGYREYKIDIILQKHEELHKIIKHVETNPNLIAHYKTVGYVDLELVFYLKNISELHKLMEDLSIKFPNTIKTYTYASLVEIHKWKLFA